MAMSVPRTTSPHQPSPCSPQGQNLISVPHFPHEDAKLRATSLKQRRGGNCGNSLEVLQQLVGCSPRPPSADLLALHLVTTLPSRHSAATAKVYASFAGEGRGGSSGGGGEETPRVDLSRCIYREDQSEAASSYILRSAATGSRTIVNHNDLLEMTVEEFVGVAESFKEEQADTWWHFEVRISVGSRVPVLGRGGGVGISTTTTMMIILHMP